MLCYTGVSCSVQYGHDSSDFPLRALYGNPACVIPLKTLAVMACWRTEEIYLSKLQCVLII